LVGPEWIIQEMVRCGGDDMGEFARQLWKRPKNNRRSEGMTTISRGGDAADGKRMMPASSTIKFGMSSGARKRRYCCKSV
jgi:hypothetical protein